MRPSVKFSVIYKNKNKYPVKTMCQFFGVSRSGYYDFVCKMGTPDVDELIASAIAECQQKCGRTYGYRRVQIWLELRKKLKRNPKTVLRIMNKYGLLAQIRRRKKYKVMSQQLHRYDNLLNRQFASDRANTKWVTDISYIHTGQGILYLSIIRDLFDNSIVAYKTGTEQTVELVLRTIKDAFINEKIATELQLHSDQGFQYTSSKYFNLTKEYGITPSMSRRGNCYDNAMAENFFSILKTECINRHKIKTLDEARELIDDYIYFYNNDRIQTETRLTPLEKRRQSA